MPQRYNFILTSELWAEVCNELTFMHLPANVYETLKVS
jgi:hypothetical protein